MKSGEIAQAVSEKKTFKQSNRVSDFCDFVCSLFPKAILFYFYFIHVYRLGARADNAQGTKS